MYVDGKLRLRTSHRYYTQVQMLMYILNLKECFFFVYTTVDSVTVLVDRDNPFLETAVSLDTGKSFISQDHVSSFNQLKKSGVHGHM
ncbi:hypothetical protein HPB47_007346 [Ixodes persulcatus]|uniref:Uncharacterized protein n=1 Tax=Ixodes persulcatus TaxID=34615 RepID=A0AC60P872_IXOPE|nr:hypothetical protein HPB47_007346 [Ixodes persulcatus]